MGTFMASVAFRHPNDENWILIKNKIKELYINIDGLVSNLDEECSGYAIVSPFGDMGSFLAEIPAEISRLTNDFVVFTTCVDSDFSMMELYHNGSLLEKCCIGEIYEEFADIYEGNTPTPSLWEPMLLDQSLKSELDKALLESGMFVEDQLRTLSELTGIPIFSDKMVFGAE